MSDTGNQDVFAPLRELWSDVEAAVVQAEEKAKELAGELITEIVADIRQVFAIGAPLAVQAILAEAPKLISGQEKFGNAVTSVAQDLQVQLGPVAIQDVQALIQTTFRGVQNIAGVPASGQPASPAS